MGPEHSPQVDAVGQPLLGDLQRGRPVGIRHLFPYLSDGRQAQLGPLLIGDGGI